MLKNHIRLVPHWITWSKNFRADFLSRCIDNDDWSVLDRIFEPLIKKFDPYSIDRFANDYNKKCQNFNTRYWCPGTNGIDAFALDWSKGNNWLVPPPRLIIECISKIQSTKCSGTLIVPS